MLLQRETSRGHTKVGWSRILPYNRVNAPVDETEEIYANILYLCMKLYLWRCRSPEAMSHAICWRIRGSGVSASAALQLQR